MVIKKGEMLILIKFQVLENIGHL